MREIKFKFLMENGEITRPYYLKELIDSDSYINIECEYSSRIKQELQYTGLKDKNKKEIYKDYLLKDDKGRLFQVIEDNRIGQTGYIMCCVKNKSENDHIQKEGLYGFYSWLTPDNYLEVIGNITKIQNF